MRAHYSGTIQKFLLARVLTFNPLTFVFARSLTHTLYDLEAAQFRVYLYNPTHWAKERGSEEMQQLINQAQHDWQLSWIGAEGKMAGITEYGNSGWVQNANKRYCGSEVIACPSFCTHHTLMCLPLLAQSPPASTST